MLRPSGGYFKNVTVNVTRTSNCRRPPIEPKVPHHNLMLGQGRGYRGS